MILEKRAMLVGMAERETDAAISLGVGKTPDSVRQGASNSKPRELVRLKALKRSHVCYERSLETRVACSGGLWRTFCVRQSVCEESASLVPI